MKYFSIAFVVTLLLPITAVATERCPQQNPVLKARCERLVSTARSSVRNSRFNPNGLDKRITARRQRDMSFLRTRAYATSRQPYTKRRTVQEAKKGTSLRARCDQKFTEDSEAATTRGSVRTLLRERRRCLANVLTVSRDYQRNKTYEESYNRK